MVTTTTPVGPRYLVDPPTPCMAKLNKLAWQPTRTYAVGDLRAGVRASHAEMDARLRAALHAHLVRDAEAAPNFSLLLGDRTARARGAGFNLLYRSSSAVVRTRDPRRLVSGLVNHLAALGPTPAGLLAVDGVALVGAAGAVVAPRSLHQWLDVVERRLRLRGVRIADTSHVLLDPHRHEVVLPEPAAIEIDWSALDGIERLAPKSRVDHPVGPGRYPLAGWAFFVGAGDKEMPRARAVALAAQRTLNAYALGLQTTLDALAETMRRIEPVGLRWTNPAAEASLLAELA